MAITRAMAGMVLVSLVATACSDGDSRAGGDLYDEATSRCVSAAVGELQVDEEDLRASLQGRDVEEFVFVYPGDLVSAEELQTFGEDRVAGLGAWAALRRGISDEGEVAIGWLYSEAFDETNGIGFTSEGKAQLYLRAEITGGSWFCKVEWEPDVPARQPWDEPEVRLEP